LAAAASTVAAAFSTSATTSPCPRIRPRHPAGIERLERVGLLADADCNLIGTAGYAMNR